MSVLVRDLSLRPGTMSLSLNPRPAAGTKQTQIPRGSQYIRALGWDRMSARAWEQRGPPVFPGGSWMLGLPVFLGFLPTKFQFLIKSEGKAGRCSGLDLG